MKSCEISPLVQPLFDKLDYSGLVLIPRKIYYEWSRYVIPEMNYLNEQEVEFFYCLNLIPLKKQKSSANCFSISFFNTN